MLNGVAGFFLVLAFYKYPSFTWPVIYNSNPIERMNKELRKRLKPMNSLTNIEAAEKIIYLQAAQRWTPHPRSQNTHNINWEHDQHGPFSENDLTF
jgi:transposase-like protein